MSLTSLLNSLHSHLQQQTQLLPTLHAQLGLPPTSLADELLALEQELTSCVERQIDLRRKQVDEWMDRCNQVEIECTKYTKALGAHVKSTGAGIGELRKEHILPRRFEALSELQERLRQLYHSKLEQLLTITNRINALSRTLGRDFYPADIREPIPVAGESSSDPHSHKDVTSERFSKLEKELVRGKGEISKRLTQLSATFVQIDWLHTELGIPPPQMDDLPSPSNCSSLPVPSISRPQSSCSNSTSNSDPFLSSMATPTPACRNKVTPTLFFVNDIAPVISDADHRRVFARFVTRLEEAETDGEPIEGTHVGLEGVDPTPALTSWAEALRTELEEVKKRREAHIQTMYDQLEALWRRLGVNDEAMDGFVEENRGSTEDNVKAYEAELERMLELKRERMGMFIDNARNEIEKLWNDLMVGEGERADFVPFNDDEHTEELLTIHEEEITRLKEERKLKGPLLLSIKKYFDIVEDETELAASASDQGRLLGRGPRDPGRLLREEKMRKRVTKEKPRLEQDLLISIPSWEAEHGRTFIVHGESILQILLETVGATAEKENQGKKKPSSAGHSKSVPRATTPFSNGASSSNHHSYAPSSSVHGKGVVTPAVRPAPGSSSQSAPNKRQRLGDSTASHPGSTRMALGVSRGATTNGRSSPISVSKLPNKPPNYSSLPRPVPMPKPGTQHYALGHGRVPSAQRQASSMFASSTSARSTSGAAGRTSRNPGRTRRESFKPRPSTDNDWGAADRRWGAGLTVALQEEDEDY